MTRKYDRRYFINKAMTALGPAFLSLVPGSIFKTRNAFCQTIKKSLRSEKQFDDTFIKTTPENLKTVLGSAAITQEEKLAILAVKDLPRPQLNQLASWVQSRGMMYTGDKSVGSFCGGGCEGGGGHICGLGCKPGPDAIGIIDRTGRLGFRMPSNVNRALFKRSFQRALTLANRK